MTIKRDDLGVCIENKQLVKPRPVCRCRADTDQPTCGSIIGRLSLLVGFYDSPKRTAARGASRRPEVNPLAFSIKTETAGIRRNVCVKAWIVLFLDNQNTHRAIAI